MELKGAFDVLGNLGNTHVLWFAVAAVVLIIMTSSALATLGSRNPFLNDPKCSRRILHYGTVTVAVNDDRDQSRLPPPIPHEARPSPNVTRP
jgi:hypothetical protein